MEKTECVLRKKNRYVEGMYEIFHRVRSLPGSRKCVFQLQSFTAKYEDTHKRREAVLTSCLYYEYGVLRRGCNHGIAIHTSSDFWDPAMWNDMHGFTSSNPLLFYLS